jgi:hypothetical protein
MADLIFDCVARGLEEATSLDKLEARGTVRLALKAAGLDARSVTKEQMTVLLQKLMATELSNRGIADAEIVAQGLIRSLDQFDAASDAGGSESPEDIFRRLGG